MALSEIGLSFAINLAADLSRTAVVCIYLTRFTVRQMLCCAVEEERDVCLCSAGYQNVAIWGYLFY